MPSTLSVGTATAGRGETAWGELPIPSPNAGRLEPPLVAVVHGRRPGPVVYLGAGAHGDEFDGIEAVRQAVLALDPTSLRGTVIAVPIQNRAAFAAQTRLTPTDGENLDHCYPGDPAGGPTAALAHLLFAEAVAKAEFALDLHTASRGGRNLLFALTAPEPPAAAAKARELARLFGVPLLVALDRVPGEPLGASQGAMLDHSLVVRATAAGIPAILVEFGEAGRLEPDQVALGRDGIRNVLAGLGLLDAAPAAHPPPAVVNRTTAVRCATAGLAHLLVRAGDRVRRGQPLARIITPPLDVEEIPSPAAGIVVRIATAGFLPAGERVAVLALV